MQGPNPDAPKVTTSKTRHALANSLHHHDQLLTGQHPNETHFYETSRSIRGEPVNLNLFSTIDLSMKLPTIYITHSSYRTSCLLRTILSDNRPWKSKANYMIKHENFLPIDLPDSIQTIISLAKCLTRSLTS